MSGGKSNWKGTERMAAALFPGGKRRPRVGGTYALTADDVVWGPECLIHHPPRVVKQFLHDGTDFTRSYPPVYIDAKKKKVSALVTEFDEVEAKYVRPKACGRLVLVTHKKGQKRVLVTVADEFFKELIESWCRERGLVSREGPDVRPK